VIKKAMVELDGTMNFGMFDLLLIMMFLWFMSFSQNVILCAARFPAAPFKKYASLRDEWAIKNRYISPGMWK
jgi:hypothetical protein